MDKYLYGYIIIFLLCFYLIYYIDKKGKMKLPESYNIDHRNDLEYYPINYNSKMLLKNENKWVTMLKAELLIYFVFLKTITMPIMKGLYYPKKIILSYINDKNKM